MILKSFLAMNVGDGATTERRTRTSRPDDESAMQKFKSTGSAQQFLSVHAYCDQVWQATTTIQACDTRRLRNEIVLHLIQVRG